MQSYPGFIAFPRKEEWWVKHVFSFGDKWMGNNSHLWLWMLHSLYERTDYLLGRKWLFTPRSSPTVGCGLGIFAQQLWNACLDMGSDPHTQLLGWFDLMGEDCRRWGISPPLDMSSYDSFVWYYVQAVVHNNSIRELLSRIYEDDNDIDLDGLVAEVNSEFEKLLAASPYGRVVSLQAC